MKGIDAFVYMDPKTLVVRPPFSNLFPTRKDVLERITASMKEAGFQVENPIDVWRQGDSVVVIDGHQRRTAALDAKLREVLVCFHDFASDEEARDYAIDHQRNRRNMQDDELMCYVEALHEKKTRGGNNNPFGRTGRGDQEEIKVTDRDFDSGRTRHEVAQKTGVGYGKAERALRVVSHAKETGDTTELDAVKAGAMSVNRAAEEVTRKRKTKQDGGKTKKKVPSVATTNGTPENSRLEFGLAPISLQDQAWLESLPARAHAQTHKFDYDALIARRVKSDLQEIKKIAESIVGKRSVSGMSYLHRLIHRLTSVPDPEQWESCRRCNGNGLCQNCHSTGYIIPGFK